MILNIKAAVRSQIPEMLEAMRSSCGSGVFTEEYLEGCIDSALLTAVITWDGTVRGVCVCCASPIPDGCEITALYIAEGFKGRGLGRKLLSHALREMRAQRYRKAFLWIDEGNVPAVGFFKKFGFEPDGKRRQSAPEAEGSCEQRLRIDI